MYTYDVSIRRHFEYLRIILWRQHPLPFWMLIIPVLYGGGGVTDYFICQCRNNSDIEKKNEILQHS